MNRGGRPEKWGEPTRPYTVRWPASHRRLYEQLAAERGISFGEYVIRTMAERHGLDLPPLPTDSPEQLPLGA